MSGVDDSVLPPEAPAIVDARIVRIPGSDQDCILVTAADGEHLAFGFEIDSDAPGLVEIDPRLWVEAAHEAGHDASELRYEAVTEAWPDEWLQALISHPVGAAWLSGIKHAHPAAYAQWFEQEDYDEGGEGG